SSYPFPEEGICMTIDTEVKRKHGVIRRYFNQLKHPEWQKIKLTDGGGHVNLYHHTVKTESHTVVLEVDDLRSRHFRLFLLDSRDVTLAWMDVWSLPNAGCDDFMVDDSLDI